MPLGFLFGIYPPVVLFFVYLIGQLNVYFLGTSEAGSILKTVLWFGFRTLICFLISLIFWANDSAAIIVTCFFAFIFSNELIYKLPFYRPSKIPIEIKASIDYHFKRSKFSLPWNFIPWVLLTIVYFIIAHASLIPSSLISFDFKLLKIIGYVLSSLSVALSLFIWLGKLFYQRKTLLMIPLCGLSCWFPVHSHFIRLI